MLLDKKSMIIRMVNLFQSKPKIIWMSPKIGVPRNHPILIGFSIINHPCLGYPYFQKPPYISQFGFFVLPKNLPGLGLVFGKTLVSKIPPVWWNLTRKQPPFEKIWGTLGTTERHEKTGTWLVRVYIGNEILPSYIRVIVNQYRDPYKPTRIQWKATVILPSISIRAEMEEASPIP